MEVIPTYRGEITHCEVKLDLRGQKKTKGARQLMGCSRPNPFILLLKREIINAVNIKIPRPYGGINYDLSVLITIVMESPDGLCVIQWLIHQ